jgi:hypothetical protein
MESQQQQETPSQYDFATMYEEWYVLQQQEQQQRRRQARSTKEGEVSSNDGSLDYTAALASRAGRLGNIQAAILCKEPTENDGYLRALLEIMHLEDEEHDNDLPLPHYCLNDIPTVNPSQATTLLEPDIDMDAFFEEYPECMKQKEDYDDSDEGEISCDEEDATTQPERKNISVSTQTDATTTEDPHLGEAQARGAFNYSQPRMDRQLINHYPSAQPQNFLPPAPDMHSHLTQRQPVVQTATTTANPRQQTVQPNQNQFQTALEFAHGGGETAPSRPPQLQQQQQPCHGYGFDYCPPEEPLEEAENPMAPALAIRDSLKRKFQIPMIGANPASSSSTNNNRKNGVAQNISGNVVSGGKASTKEDDNGNDDLPEELKRFGKDLVDKIRDEIMDNKERITFADIAGLEDAKATIQEIVCWPMKRPDLFTGLRRTPNGLLLFGKSVRCGRYEPSHCNNGNLSIKRPFSNLVTKIEGPPGTGLVQLLACRIECMHYSIRSHILFVPLIM